MVPALSKNRTLMDRQIKRNTRDKRDNKESSSKCAVRKVGEQLVEHRQRCMVKESWRERETER